MLLFLILAGGCLALFGILQCIEPRRLMNGMVFTCFLGFLLLGMLALVGTLGGGMGVSLVLIALVLLLPLAFLAAGVAMVINGTVLMRLEGRRLRNLLSMALGLMILLFMLALAAYPLLARYRTSSAALVTAMAFMVLYVSFLFVSYLAGAVFFGFPPPRLNQHFLVVLGCGVKGERVPPLLAGRLDKAVQFYFRQARRTQPPCLIVCGGKGEGEDIPEAEAMARYLREKGIPEENIRREDQSTNTYENLRNAKGIMDSAMGRYRCALVTSNYHLFRAALLSRKVGIRRCRGLGSPTAGYYLPNAFLREFIGALALHKRWHIAVCVILALMTLGAMG